MYMDMFIEKLCISLCATCKIMTHVYVFAHLRNRDNFQRETYPWVFMQENRINTESLQSGQFSESLQCGIL